MTATRPAGQRLRIDPRIRERRRDVARSAGRRRLRMIVALFVVGSVGFSIRLLLSSSWLSVHSVSISGSSKYSSAQIMAAGKLVVGEPLIYVNSSLAAKRIESLPWISTARVIKKWPDALQVDLSSRVPIAELYGPTGPYGAVDLTGRVIQLGQLPGTGGPNSIISLCYRSAVSSSKALADLKTCVNPPIPAGGNLPGSYDPLLRLAGAVRASSLRADVHELVSSSPSHLYAVLSDGVAVRFGSDAALSQKLRALELIRSQVSTAGYSTIDVRVPSEPVLSHW